MKQIYANFVGELKNNEWFDKDYQDSQRYPFWLLREQFATYNISLNTPDINAGRSITFTLHMNASLPQVRLSYLFLWETGQIAPQNRDQKLLAAFYRIFTWDNRLVDKNRFVHYKLPVYYGVTKPFSEEGFASRSSFCCLIAGNKTTPLPEPLELYSERVRTIRWFERYAPEDFDLYGTGWMDLPPSRGRFNKFRDRIWAHIRKRIKRSPAFPSYRGRVPNKQEVLLQYKFCICYENVQQLPGYVTEKIFDCLLAGCIPVYWGAPNISDYIPSDCYINRENFKSHEELYHFLNSMSEATFIGYQQAIKKYLSGSGVHTFSAQRFVDTVVSSVVDDLKRENLLTHQ